MSVIDEGLSECLRQWKLEIKELEEQSWKEKPMHRMYDRHIAQVTGLTESYQWVERARLKGSTEALIMAAQEQTLSTRTIEAQIYNTRQDSMCSWYSLSAIKRVVYIGTVSWSKLLVGSTL